MMLKITKNQLKAICKRESENGFSTEFYIGLNANNISFSSVKNLNELESLISTFEYYNCNSKCKHAKYYITRNYKIYLESEYK